MRRKVHLLAATAAITLILGAGLPSGRARAQVDCADRCLAAFATCVNQNSEDCQDALDRCLEDCLRME